MFFSKKKTATDRVNELVMAGQKQEAINLCRDVCYTSDATHQDWLLYGRLSADAGDLTKARKAFKKAIELDNNIAEAHFGLGKALATSGDYPAALESLQQAAQLQPDNAEIWLALGITYGVSQQIGKAEECCRQSLTLQPDSASARFNLGNALQGQGKLAEAEVEYEAALRLEPKMVAGWFMLAQARVGVRKFAEAKVAASRALTLAPNMGEAHFTLGSAAEALGDTEQARDCYRQATMLLPGLPDAHMRLGLSLIGLGDYADASKSFQEVVKLNPSATAAQFRMGQCFSELGQVEQALGCYRRAVELKPDHLQAHYFIALICGNQGDYAEAATHLAEVLRINPKDDQARHLLAAYQGQTTATAPAAYVSTLFDGFADTFDEKLVDELGYHIPEIMHGRVSQVVAPAAESLDVIDLGCGTGLCAPLFRGMARTLHGVDLSPKMIEKARQRGLYDTLEVNDVASSMVTSVDAWDLALSADVFVYVGELQPIFIACAAALRPGGMFAFSVEADDDIDTFILRSTGRYAHASRYIRGLATRTGFREIDRHDVVVRKDKGQDIRGYIFIMQCSADLS